MNTTNFDQFPMETLINRLVEQVKYDLQSSKHLKILEKQIEEFLSQNLAKTSCHEFKRKVFSTEFPSKHFPQNCSIQDFLYIVYFIAEYYDVNGISKEEDDKNVRKMPNDLISLQTLKNIEILTKFIFTEIYLLCLDKDASVYLKIKLLQGDQRNLNITKICQFKTLILTLECLLPLFKHEVIGAHLQNKFFTELLCGILQLSFSPFAKSNFPSEVEYFRDVLNYYLETKSSLILKSVLLLKGIFSQQHEKNYINTVCQSLFTRRYLLNANNGLAMIINVCIDLGPLNDLKRKEAIASLIAFAKVSDEAEFFNVLGPQVLRLLQSQQKGEIFHVLALILNQLNERNAFLLHQNFFTALLLPLSKLTEREKYSYSGEDLVNTVVLLYKLYVELLPSSTELLSHLEFVLGVLFEIAILPPTCHIKSKARRLIVRYLSTLEADCFVPAVLSVTRLKNNGKIPQVNKELKFVPKLNSVEVEYRDNMDDWSEVDEKKIKLLIHILEKTQDNSLLIKFFESLVSYIDFTIFNNIVDKPASKLLTDADINELKFEKFRSLVFVVGVISAVSENEDLMSKIFNDVKSALSVIKILLETHRQQCSDLELSEIKDSFLISCNMLLSGYVTTIIHSGKTRTENWDQFQDIVQSLKSLVRDSQNSTLVTMSQQLLNIILTHGVIPPSASDCDTLSLNLNTRKKHSFNESSDSSESLDSSFTQDSKKDLSPFKEALMQLYSPHIPIRGHALISLNHLIEKEDKETIENTSELLPVLEYYLKDEDSYIYLGSIKALASLATKYPKKILATLTKEFSIGKHDPECRMKVMEILTETARRLGEVLPMYKNEFLNCVINGIKDKDSLIRASCLSNLGEICRLLHFSVESVLFEIFSVVDHIIKYESSSEVKRAAVLLITLLFQGLGKDSLKVLQSLMLEIYRGLKRLILNSNDPVLVTHAELAMEEINAATKEFLLPKLNMTKKIYITEVPPNSF